MICLILPNYMQSSKIFALVFNKETQRWRKEIYSQAVSSLGLPKSWARGIPGPVQQRHPENDFVLGQLATASSGITYQSWACRAGVDTTGRDVFLTLIAQNEDEVKEAFPCGNPKILENIITETQEQESKNAEETDYYQITETQKKYFKESLCKITQEQSLSNNNIQKMLYKAQRSHFKHYASVSFNGMSYLPDSEQGDDAGHLPFRNSRSISLLALVILLAFGLTLYTVSSKKTANKNSKECDNPSTSQSKTCDELSIQQ